MMKSKFTLIELAVVVVVMIVLATAVAAMTWKLFQNFGIL